MDLYEKARKYGQFSPYIFERLSGVVCALVAMVIGVVALMFVSPWLALIVVAVIVSGLSEG